MVGAFDPIKYQTLVSQSKHFHFQEVHQADTCGRNAECEVGQLLMSLQEHPKNKQRLRNK